MTEATGTTDASGDGTSAEGAEGERPATRRQPRKRTWTASSPSEWRGPRASSRTTTSYKAKPPSSTSRAGATRPSSSGQAEELNRWQTEAETWRKAAVGNRIEALASTDFADPSDAIAALSGTDYLDAGGQIDEAASARPRRRPRPQTALAPSRRHTPPAAHERPHRTSLRGQGAVARRRPGGGVRIHPSGPTQPVLTPPKGAPRWPPSSVQ
jgi:hypothetical protein